MGRQLENKVCIITGSNRGIGKAMVETFAASGANIWACARKANSEFETWLYDTAERHGVWIKPVYFELTDIEAVNAGIQSIIDEGQPIDVLVNNAGISTVGLLSMSKVEDIEKLFNVNYFAMLRIIQKISKRMSRQRKGVSCDDDDQVPGQGVRPYGYPGERHRPWSHRDGDDSPVQG